MIFSMLKIVFPVIYIGFSVLTYILFLIRGRIVYAELKKEYSSFTTNYIELHKESIDKQIIQQIIIFVGCFTPILHLSLFYHSVISKKRLKEKVLDEMTNSEEL